MGKDEGVKPAELQTLIIREITHLSEITSVSLTGGLGSGDLVGSSGSSSSLEGGTDSGTSDLELVVSFCVLTISISCPVESIRPLCLHPRPSVQCDAIPASYSLPFFLFLHVLEK
jgi:hypothetical protein